MTWGFHQLLQLPDHEKPLKHLKIQHICQPSTFLYFLKQIFLFNKIIKPNKEEMLLFFYQVCYFPSFFQHFFSYLSVNLKLIENVFEYYDLFYIKKSKLHF